MTDSLQHWFLDIDFENYILYFCPLSDYINILFYVFKCFINTEREQIKFSISTFFLFDS